MARRMIAGGVLIHKGRALIVKRSHNQIIHPNKWELPSGKVEEGEHVHNAVLREFFEETGIKASLAHKRPVRTDGYYLPTIKGPRHFNQKIYLLIQRALEPKIRLSKEHNDFAWIRLEEVRNYQLLPGVIEDIQAAFKKHSELRLHLGG